MEISGASAAAHQIRRAFSRGPAVLLLSRKENDHARQVPEAYSYLYTLLGSASLGAPFPRQLRHDKMDDDGRQGDRSPLSRPPFLALRRSQRGQRRTDGLGDGGHGLRRAFPRRREARRSESWRYRQGPMPFAERWV